MASVSLATSVLVVLLLVVLMPHGGSFLTTFGKSSTPSCPAEKFDCKNGVCITGSQWCDGYDNCGNSADEMSCPICMSGSLKCKVSKQCVPAGARCNGITECKDETDEIDCIYEEETQQETSGAVNLLLSTVVLLLTVALSMR